jgi:fructose-1,6-bisphosphatase-3
MKKKKDNDFSTKELEEQLKFLSLLSEKFPNIQAASTEIINMEAILNLPKGTEHFLTDIHGEYETFSHVLANASGVVRRKIDDVFGNTLRLKDKKTLATLIYYPKEKLDLILKDEEDPNEWYAITLQRLSHVARSAATKYTRSKVRKAMPKDFAYIIDELLNEGGEGKEEYFEAIIKAIIKVDRAEAFIIAMCKFIQRLLIDRLHIIGDIYDRGPHAEKVMDRLMNYHSVDVQWGNHDIIWMGAATGNQALVANVIRISLRYQNLDTMEDAYGINMLPLATFAMKQYENDPCSQFGLKVDDLAKENRMLVQMHKAIAIIQFKLESQIIQRNPNFGMDDRLLLDKIDLKSKTVMIGGQEHPLLDAHFPTLDPKNPFKLTAEEKDVIDKLTKSFKNSKRLQRHVDFLFSNGSMYLTYNSNLLYHGCIPLTEKGTFASFEIEGATYKGKVLCDHFERVARKAYARRSDHKSSEYTSDYMWYYGADQHHPCLEK